MTKYLLISIAFLLGVTGCSESTVDPETDRVGFNHFPLETGRYVDYQVEETTYTIQGDVEASTYQLRVEVVDSFQSLSGDTRYEVHRSKRNDENDDWDFITAWTAYKSGNNAVVIEENVPFIKLSFPFSDGKSWDGNAANTLEEDEYELDSLGADFVLPTGAVLENTVTVVQSNNLDFIIQQDRRVEIYALNIGLIYKEALLYNYCAEEDCLGQQIIDSGTLFRQTVISYGKN